MFKAAPTLLAGALLTLTSADAFAQRQAGKVFQEHEEARQNKGFDRPEINPSPQKTLILQGHKSAELEVWFSMGYETSLEKCRTQALLSRVLGAPDVPQTVDEWVRVPAGQTDFSVSFYLDRYLPGHCGWQPFGVLHAEFDPRAITGPLSSSGVVAIRPVGKQRTRLVWTCRQVFDPVDPKKLPHMSCLNTNRRALEDTIVSMDGGVVEVVFTLESEGDSS